MTDLKEQPADFVDAVVAKTTIPFEGHPEDDGSLAACTTAAAYQHLLLQTDLMPFYPEGESELLKNLGEAIGVESHGGNLRMTISKDQKIEVAHG